MALVDYISLQENDIIGIWKNSESLEDLLLDLKPMGDMLKQLNELKSLKRQKEFCYIHLLVRELIGKSVLIKKDEFGKPILVNFPFHISVTHTNDYCAVFLSEHQFCGIDIESTGRNLSKIHHKFVSSYEQLYVTKGNENAYYLIIWTVKEAIYKWYGKKGLDFIQNMIVHPFTLEEESGVVYFEFVFQGKKITNIAYYKIQFNHIVTWLQGEST